MSAEKNDEGKKNIKGKKRERGKVAFVYRERT